MIRRVGLAEREKRSGSSFCCRCDRISLTETLQNGFLWCALPMRKAWKAKQDNVLRTCDFFSFYLFAGKRLFW